MGEKIKAKINGIPYWYYPETDEFEPKYFFSDALLWLTDHIKMLISMVTGIENTFYVQIEKREDETRD